MKKTLSLLTIAATIVVSHSASADFINQVVTSAGGTGTANITGTTAALTSFVAGGVTYDSFIGIGVNDPSPAATLWTVGTTDPGSDTAAVSDLDLSTGTLNNGTDARYDLTGQTLSASTTIFLFGNGGGSVTVDVDGNAIGGGGTTPPGTVTFVDAADGNLGTVAPDFFFQDPGVNTIRAPNLISADLARVGNTLNGRTISGAIFTLSDITFTSGGIGDIAGFRISSASTDIQDVGIAFAIPEPSSVILLLGGGLGAIFFRRRK